MADAAGAGFFLDNNSNRMKFNNMTFKYNTAYDLGSSFHIDSSKDIIINNTYYYNNTAESEGGALMLSEVDNVEIYNTYIEQNISFKGNFWLQEIRNATIKNATCINNIATTTAGGLLIENSRNITLTNSLFQNNTSH